MQVTSMIWCMQNIKENRLHRMELIVRYSNDIHWRNLEEMVKSRATLGKNRLTSGYFVLSDVGQFGVFVGLPTPSRRNVRRYQRMMESEGSEVYLFPVHLEKKKQKKNYQLLLGVKSTSTSSVSCLLRINELKTIWIISNPSI